MLIIRRLQHFRWLILVTNDFFGNNVLRKTSDTIEYVIRKSQRTKRLHLKINRLGEIEVVSPGNVTRFEIDQFVSSHISWIEKQRSRILTQVECTPELSKTPPDNIYFPLLKHQYEIEYSSLPNKRNFIVGENTITIFSQCDIEKRNLLQKFIHGIAKKELTLMLEELSYKHELPFNKVFIKAQKTRWGSCSSKKNINLNRNLLFLNKDQVEYLIVHELCHTIHLNHSPRYWQLVSEFIPQYKKIDKSLRNASATVPLWAIA